MVWKSSDLLLRRLVGVQCRRIRNFEDKEGDGRKIIYSVVGMRRLLPRDLELATGLYFEGDNISLSVMIPTVTSSASITFTFTFVPRQDLLTAQAKASSCSDSPQPRYAESAN
jgi:hypothetical protein